MKKFNICTASDSYKFQHWNMYPKGTEKVYSYFESRKGADYPSTVFFGLQYLLKEYFIGKVVTERGIATAKERIDAHLAPGAFNEKAWRYILNDCDGKLPITIKAVPEGLAVPTNNVLMTVENDSYKDHWLTNYLETLLSQVWSPSTVATASYHAKQMMMKFLVDTSDDPETAIAFMLHDFGFRGTSSFESACTAGAGHLVNFMGTDTFPAVELTMDYYNSKEVTAFSVPATEHSIMTARGKGGEMEILGDLLDKYPSGILSIVIDSYDYREFIREAARRFKDKIEARTDVVDNNDNVIAPGKLVFRPDSGMPNEVTMECAELLERGFGTTVNTKGYKIFNPKIGLLWGDGIDIAGARSILFTLTTRGYAASNIVFGMGGGLLQKINRDTQRFAFKSSYQERLGVGYDIWKEPIDISKTSKKGKLMLILTEDGGYKTVKQDTDVSTEGLDLLETVFKNGELVRDMTFNEVRNNANK